MRIICPVCSAMFSLDAAADEEDKRQFANLAGEISAKIQINIVPYIGLFRPAGGSLQWRKAARLAGDLLTMISDSDIPERFWYAGVEKMLDRRNELQLPMKNHKYLAKIARDLHLSGVRQAQSPEKQSAVRKAKEREAHHPERQVWTPANTPAHEELIAMPEEVRAIITSMGRGKKIGTGKPADPLKKANKQPADIRQSVRKHIEICRRENMDWDDIEKSLPAHYMDVYRELRPEFKEAV